MATNFVEEFLVGLGFKFEGEDGERFKKQTETIASAINKVTMAAVAASAALLAMAKAGAAENAEMGRTAAALDTSAQAIMRWKHAADIAGVGGDNVVKMLENLRGQAIEAQRTGSGPFRAYYELGVDFQALASGGLDVADALDQIIANAQKMDRTVAKGALRDLGIDERFLDTPLSELHKAMDDADKYGHVTDNLTELSIKFEKSQANLGLRWEGLQNQLAERMLPTMIKFFEVLTSGLEWVQNKGIPIIDQVVEAFGGWDKVMLGMTALALPGLIAGLSKVLTLVTGISGGAAGAGAAIALLFRAGMVGAAGYAGWEAGSAINNALPQDVQDAIGEYLTKTLAFVGVKDAQESVDSMARGEAAMRGEDPAAAPKFESFWDVLERNRRDAAERHYEKNPQDRPATGPDAIIEEKVPEGEWIAGPEKAPVLLNGQGGARSTKKPTMDEWLSKPYDPNAPEPDFPVAGEAPAEDDPIIPDIVNEADLHKVVPRADAQVMPPANVTNDNRKNITNNFNGVPLNELDEHWQQRENEESQFMENENQSPVVR